MWRPIGLARKLPSATTASFHSPPTSRWAQNSVLVDCQNGKAALHKAASFNQSEVAKVLIAAGADLNAKYMVAVPDAPLAAADSVLVDGQSRKTPVHCAKYFKHQDMVTLVEASVRVVPEQMRNASTT